MIADDDQTWEDAIEGAAPLEKNVKVEKPYVPAPRKQVDAPTLSPTHTPTPRHKDGLVDKSTEEIFAAHAPGLSPKMVRSLRRGEVAFTAKMDLHGLVVEEAYQTCFGFLLAAQAEGHRCVIVIHGKGEGRAGPIKQNISTWLQQHPSVLGFHTAQPKHGGSGAVYVLLRKP